MRCRSIRLAVIIFSLLLLGACGFKTDAYFASHDNVVILKNIPKANKVAVSSFSGPGKKSLMCRLAGPIENPGGVTFEDYIRAAMISELQGAGLYDEQSSTQLVGSLEFIQSDSVSPAKWKFVMGLAKNDAADPMAFPVESEYPFATSFIADKACLAAAKAFSPAVRTYLAKIYADPNFVKIMQKK